MQPQPSPADESRRERLGRDLRLRKRRDFLRVQGQGRRIQTRHFVLMVCAADAPKVGVTVTKRIGSAVRRNRVKRLVREFYRRNRTLFPARAEVVFIARRGAPALTYDDLAQELQRVRPQLRAAGARR